MSKSLNYSIIIPHRNVPHLLLRCLNSIPCRNDLEIIIVDDNSSPDIVDFANYPGKDRKDVKIVFNKDGKGAGRARNIGLEIAKGYWTLFADADDYYSDSINELLDKYAYVRNLDMVFINALAVNERGQTRSIQLNLHIKNYLANRYKSLDSLRYQYWTPWCRIIRRSIFSENGIQFEEVPLGNDTMAMLKACRYSINIAVEPDVYYYYYKPSGGSLTDKAYNEETFLLRIKQKLDVNKFYLQVGYPFLWPIRRMISKQKMKNQKLKQLLHEYDYSLFTDIINHIRYYIAKSIGII